MSFDLLVFDPELVQHRDSAPFIEWFDELTEWDDAVDYNDPATASPRLQSSELLAAAKHSLGVFDPQDGTVYLPAPDGVTLMPAFRVGE